jgi:hypothetical protein
MRAIFMRNEVNKDHQKVTEILYNELVELYGDETANEILRKEGIDFRFLSLRIWAEKFKRKHGISNRLFIAIVLLVIVLLFILMAQ